MKKTWIGAFGILACTAGPISADGFSQEDQALIAGKGIFPGDGTDDEGVLPEASTTDNPRKTKTTPGSSNHDKAEKNVAPEANKKQLKGVKDIFPPEEKAPKTQAK